MGLTDILSLAIAAILVNNYILVQFLGCCSFFGVSKKTDTALGMGMAVIFVMAIASAASWAVQYFILEPLGLGFTFALVLMGFFRELLGAGTILSGYVNGVNGIAVPFFHSNPMVMMILPAGGFLMMGFILAAIQKIMARKEDK